MLQDKEASNLI